MKTALGIVISLLLLCSCTPTTAPNATSQVSLSTSQPAADPNKPEVVRSESVVIESGLKTIVVGNTNGRYTLSCNVKAAGCTTPEPDRGYLVFKKNTSWKRPGSTLPLTLAFVQDWTVTYTQTENIGLIPEVPDALGRTGGPSELGIYMLRSWSANR